MNSGHLCPSRSALCQSCLFAEFLESLFRKLLPVPTAWCGLLIFSSGILKVLGLQSILSFGFGLILLHINAQLAQHYLLERCSFFPSVCFCVGSEEHSHLNLFLDLQLCPIALHVSLCANTMVFGLQWLYTIFWNQILCCTKLCIYVLISFYLYSTTLDFKIWFSEANQQIQNSGFQPSPFPHVPGQCSPAVIPTGLGTR